MQCVVLRRLFLEDCEKPIRSGTHNGITWCVFIYSSILFIKNCTFWNVLEKIFELKSSSIFCPWSVSRLYLIIFADLVQIVFVKVNQFVFNSISVLDIIRHAFDMFHTSFNTLQLIILKVQMLEPRLDKMMEYRRWPSITMSWYLEYHLQLTGILFFITHIFNLIQINLHISLFSILWRNFFLILFFLLTLWS